MNQGRTVFSQLLSFLPDREFRRCVARYGGDARPRGFSCWDQYLSMAFAQLTYRDGLRDIEACLRSLGGKLYHMGFHSRVARSTLADANDSHDWRIYADFAQVLIRLARPLYASDPIGVELEQSLYALDSTTIDLCLSLFPWAKFRKHKAAVKMHTLLDLHGNIPTFISITSGKVHDVNILDEIEPEAGAFYVMDRGYVDFERLYVFTLSAAFFVVRTKSNVLLQRRYSHSVDKTTGVRSDHTVILTAIDSVKGVPGPAARIGASRSFARSPGTVCLRSGSCTSARTFAPPFFQTSRHRYALALRYHFTLHQVVKGTSTPELSNMLGTQKFAADQRRPN